MRSEGILTDVSKFVSDHGVRCTHALERLRSGLPATAVAPSADERGSMAVVAESVRGLPLLPNSRPSSC